MDKTLLQTARNSLRIIDVALRDARAALADDFEPKYQDLSSDVQLMQRTLRSQTMEVDNIGDSRRLFQVFVRLGVRWVNGAETDEQQDESGVQAVIEATFVAEYEITASIEQPALDEFAMHNAPWHIWPYWREYVATQCNRLNLPKATLPMQCLSPQGQTASDTTDS